jgi:hypothetical protein
MSYILVYYDLWSFDALLPLNDPESVTYIILIWTLSLLA